MNMDEKHRLVVPAPYRQELGSEMLLILLDNGNLAVAPLSERVRYKPETYVIVRTNSVGRILIPQGFREEIKTRKGTGLKRGMRLAAARWVGQGGRAVVELR